MSNPLVSVIIPVYNAEQFLLETLDSVFAQTYTNVEVIAVDDGSTDRSAEIIKSYPAVKYIRQKNGGVSNARNTGIKASSGDYIAFLDHDDIWLPEKLKIQVKIASRHRESGIFFCDGVIFSSDGLISRHLLDQDIIRELEDAQSKKVYIKNFYNRLLKNNPIGCNSQELIPRHIIDEIGLLAEKRTDYSAAYDYYLRIATKYPFTFHGDSLVRYRYHPLSQSGSMEFRQFKHIFMKINVLKEHLKKQLYPRGRRRDVKKAYHHLTRIAARQSIKLAATKNAGYARSYLYKLFRFAPTNRDVLVCFSMSWLPRRMLMLLIMFLTRIKNTIKKTK